MSKLAFIVCGLAAVFAAEDCPGAAAVRLNNYDAKSPAFYFQELAYGTNVHVQVLGGPIGGTLAPLLDPAGNPITIFFTEPGLFDAGVGIIPGSTPEGGFAEFQLRCWTSGNSFESSYFGRITARWTQRVGSYPPQAGTNGPVPLEIPNSLVIGMGEFEPPIGLVAVAARGSGRVFIYPKKDVYVYDDFILVEAVPDPGYGFTGWWGGLAGGGSVVSGRVGQLFTGLAVFKPVWRLDIATPLGGMVTASPTSNLYLDGSQVTLQAVPDNHFGFKEWSGDMAETNQITMIQMDTNKTVGVIFYPLELPLIMSNKGKNGSAMSPDGFGLLLFGESSKCYEIQSSSNLLNWSSLGVVTPATGVVEFLDSSATNITRRFYRAKED